MGSLKDLTARPNSVRAITSPNDTLNPREASVVLSVFMPEAPQAPTTPDHRDEDRGLFDLPDFGELIGKFKAWCGRNPASAALLFATLGAIGYFYFNVKAFQSLSQTAAEWIGASWNAENDQEHCWAIIPVSIFLVLLRWRDLKAAPKSPANSGLWFIVAGILAFVVGVRCMEGRFTIFALPLLGYGIARYLFGAAVARIVLFPCVFLLFMVPIGMVVQGTVELQVQTAKVIHHLSSFFGIPIAVEGAKITSLDGRFEPLEVAGGCSGIRSLMAMLTLSALYAYFVMRTPLRGMILFGLSLGFAVLGNFARVFSVVLFARFIDPKTATGLYHDYSGFVFFPVAVLAMVAVGNLLNRDWARAWNRWHTPTLVTGTPPSGGGTASPEPTTPDPANPTSNVPTAQQPQSPSRYDY